jgi:hypothetical protein
MVRGMRRQGERRGQASSLSEGQEVSEEYRFDLFGKTDASEEDALAVAGKSKRPNHFFSFCLQVLECAENSAIRNLHPPKGRRFQEDIALICSERPAQAKFRKSERRKVYSICSVCSERTVASGVRKIRGLEVLFYLFGVLVSK